MAATFTEITLEEMEGFLKRAFRGYKPKKGIEKGQYAFTLHITDDVGIRILSSIPARGEKVRGVGDDTINLLLWWVKKDYPMTKDKALVVKRVGGWKANLQDRIEDLVEAYEEKAEYWDARATGNPAPVSNSDAKKVVDQEAVKDFDVAELEDQVKTVTGLDFKLRRDRSSGKVMGTAWETFRKHRIVTTFEIDRAAPGAYEAVNYRFSGGAKDTITDWERESGWQRDIPTAWDLYVNRVTDTIESWDAQEIQDSATREPETWSGTWSKLRSGDWGVRVNSPGVKPGDKIQVTRADGRKSWVNAHQVITTGPNFTIVSVPPKS